MLSRKAAASPAPLAPAGAGISPSRLALREQRTITADIRKRRDEAMAPNPRLQAAFDDEAKAKAALAGIDASRAAELGRHYRHGGALPEPRVEERIAAQSRLAAATAAADVARGVGAECGKTVEYLNGLLNAALQREQALIADILVEDVLRQANQRMAEFNLAANRELWIVRAIGMLQVGDLKGVIRPIFGNVYAIPAIISAPVFENLPVHGDKIDAQEGQRAAMATVRKFMERLATDANAQLADLA